MPTTRKKKIAVLGGGPAAITAAFWLTVDPNWRKHYEVTVYQMGWRLGGKCTSGVNQDENGRVEEHGLHMLGGFYENTFRTIRRAYAECAHKRLKGVGTFEEKFAPLFAYDKMEKIGDDWKFWNFSFPKNQEKPGEEYRFKKRERPGTPWSYVRKVLGLMLHLYEKNEPDEDQRPRRPDLNIPEDFQFPAEVAEVLRELSVLVISDLALTIGRASITFLDLAHELAMRLGDDPRDHTYAEYMALSMIAGEIVDRTKRSDQLDAASDELRRLAIIINTGAAMVVGMIADGVILEGYKPINKLDFREWMTNHGCSYPDSPLIRAGYQACFAYEGGDTNNPQFAAGVALYGALRMFDYRTAPWWQMNGGTGDCVFAPLYKVLDDRKVKFKFFHEVKKLHVSDDGNRIEKIDIDVQANLRNETYDPLLDTLQWPNQPQGKQLAGNVPAGHNFESPNHPVAAGTITLRRGDPSENGFDYVILGIPIAALQKICSELDIRSSKWRLMLEKLQTVQTQALQVWFKASSSELGYGGESDPPCATAFEPPFDTYKGTDLEGKYIRHYASLCAVLPDGQDLDDVRKNEEVFFTRMSQVWWPNFNREAFAGQPFVKANTFPADRYTLSLPGTVEYRIRPDKSGFENLYLAGDWTLTDLNCGCFEAAVISGMMASQAICQQPEHIYARPIDEEGIEEEDRSLLSKTLDFALKEQRSSYWWDWQTPEITNETKLRKSFSLKSVAEIEGINLTTFLLGYREKPALREILPKDVGLDTPPWAPQGRHPVLYAFGFQRDVTPPVLRWPGVEYLRIPALNYFETVVGVPNVLWTKHGKVEGPFFYITDIRLDSMVAKVAGWFAGYPKHIARIDVTTGADARDSVYRVQSTSGDAVLLSANFRAIGQEGHRLSESEESMAIGVFLKQPWLTRSDLGGYVSTEFEIDEKKTLIQQVVATIEVNTKSIPGLPQGEFNWMPGDKGERQTTWATIHTPKERFARAEIVPGVAFRALFQWRAIAKPLEMKIPDPLRVFQRTPKKTRRPGARR
jgi:uncharacterized protein with NAD-binding domain and iron-sulfur cluster